ncbi:MAG: hypothetical protein J0L94_15305 [Rhodothermia bacterium]|nr:hypothetical protein [Rhodothermia bacterium]
MKQQITVGAALLFGVFGFLAALDHENGLLLVLIAVGLGALGIVALQSLLTRFNEVVQASSEMGFLAIKQGLAFFVPFVVLAIVADGFFEWHSAQAFFSAGVSALGASCGAYLMQQGASKMGGFVVPMAWALGCSAIWMLLTAAF